MWRLSLFVTILVLLVVGWLYASAPSAPIVVGSPVERLAEGEFDALQDELVAMIANDEVSAALSELEQRTEESEQVRRDCHELSHALGHAAYKSLAKDFAAAAVFARPFCNSGYLHGVIEAHFQEAADVFALMDTTCDAYELGSFMSWECYHGIGHGLMYYTGNDVPGSLAHCAQLDSDFASNHCANGVYMENFAADDLMHPTLWQRPDDPFYPCAEQPEDQKANCYLYTPSYYLRLHPSAYEEALQWCQTAEPGFEGTCARGVGGEAMQQNFERVDYVESVCATAPFPLETDCVRGMVGLTVSYTGTIEAAEALCAALSLEHQDTCWSEVESKRAAFTDFQ